MNEDIDSDDAPDRVSRGAPEAESDDVGHESKWSTYCLLDRVPEMRQARFTGAHEGAGCDID
jgi:hypothetical protein